MDDKQYVYLLAYHPTTISTQENDAKQVQLEYEAYQAWLKKSPFHFPLFPKSPIHNIYNYIGSSHVGDEDNDKKVMSTHDMEFIFFKFIPLI